MWFVDVKSLRKGIIEREGGLPGFGTDNLNIFLPTVEIITRLADKIGSNLPSTKGLIMVF